MPKVGNVFVSHIGGWVVHAVPLFMCICVHAGVLLNVILPSWILTLLLVLSLVFLAYSAIKKVRASGHPVRMTYQGAVPPWLVYMLA